MPKEEAKSKFVEKLAKIVPDFEGFIKQKAGDKKLSIYENC